MVMPHEIDPELLAQVQSRLDAGTMSSIPNPTAAPSNAPISMGPYTMPASALPAAQAKATALGQGGAGPYAPATPKAPDTIGPPVAARGDFVNGTGAAPGADYKIPGMTTVGAHSSSNVSPEIRKEYDAALKSREGLPREEANAQIGANEAQANLLDKQQAALGTQMLESQNAQRARSAALDSQMADYKRFQDDASNQKVDPQRAWGSRSAASKALGVVGILLSSFGEAHTGQNSAMNVINKQINDDIDSQKGEIAGKQKKADAAQNMYQMKVRQFGDEGAADIATRAQMLEQYKVQLQSEALRTGSPILIAKAKEAAAQMGLEQAKLHSQLETWHQTGTAGGLTAEDQKRAFELAKDYNMPVPQAIQMVLAIRGVAPSAGLQAPHKDSKGGGEESAANALINRDAPPALSLGDRIEAGAASLPLVGKAFQGTEGAQKALAQEASNIPVLGYGHKVLGARTPEAQEHVMKALIVQPGDSQGRITQKLALQAKIASESRKGGGGGGNARQFIESDEDE